MRQQKSVRFLTNIEALGINGPVGKDGAYIDDHCDTHEIFEQFQRPSETETSLRQSIGKGALILADLAWAATSWAIRKAADLPTEKH